MFSTCSKLKKKTNLNVILALKYLKGIILNDATPKLPTGSRPLTLNCIVRRLGFGISIELYIYLPGVAVNIKRNQQVLGAYILSGSVERSSHSFIHRPLFRSMSLIRVTLRRIPKHLQFRFHPFQRDIKTIYLLCSKAYYVHLGL